ncbi:MAG: glycosyltransferase [Chloroflexi bacterium]|nr:glycosyltransferase [Chloroflexota bacterium]
MDWIVRGLRADGHVVDVLSANEIPRWTVGEARISSFLGHWPRVSRELDRYDIINLHGPAPTMSDAFLALFNTRRSSRRPALVYTHHSCIDIQGIGTLCRIYDRMTARLSALADRIIVTSPSYADIVRRPNSPPIDIIPWGIDVSAFGGQDRVPSDGPLRVLFVGQLRPYKGVSTLIAAVSRRPEIRLTIAGDGPLAATHRAQASAAGADNISFAGRITDEELSRLYHENDVIALPSTTRAEAFGLVLLEGMAAGCVPLASNLPGVCDVAGPTGVLVKPGDPVALRDALLDLAADPDRIKRLSRESRRFAISQPWHAVSNAYAVSFEEAIHERGTARWSEALRRSMRPPELRLPALAERFDATWWSLVVFDDQGHGRQMARWGRGAAQEFRREPPGVAAYVAQAGEPMLLDRDLGPAPIRSMLRRPDIRSALAVPIEMEGTRGVLSLTAAGLHRDGYSQVDLDDLVQLVAR